MKKIGIYLLTIMFLLTGCSSGISKEEYEKVVAENEELKAKLSNYNKNETDSQANNSTENINNKSKNDTTNNFSETMEFDSIDTSDLQGLLNNGVYKCGVDFEPGDYYIISLCGADAGYSKGDTASDIQFDKHRIIRFLSIDKGEYIQLENTALLVPKDMIDTQNWNNYGVFAVGSDLPAGEYKIQSTTDSYDNEHYDIHLMGNLSAYEIFDDTPEFGESIKCSFMPNKQEYITLKEGQYIALNHSKLSAVNE